MIITQLFGGFGNQMFQYAIAKSLSMHKNMPLKLDHNHLTLINQQYCLDIFDTEFSLIKNGELHQLQILSEKNELILAQEKQEKEFQYDESIFSLSGKNIYLSGYWQNAQYFANIASELRNDFKFKKIENKNYQKMLEEIKNCNSVAIHIRRADYANNPGINKLFGLCSLNYYRKACDFIIKNIPKVIFYVFVFDVNFEWVKNYFTIPYQYKIVDINDAKNYKYDLELMTNCKHQIIANSSFSWWAAWLNPNKQKLICAPKEWMQNTNKNTSNLIPDNWCKF